MKISADMTISLVDISSIGLSVTSPTDDDLYRVGRQLDSAFSKTGFVYLTGHGIDEDRTIKRAMEQSEIFFNKNEEFKKLYEREDKNGWVAQGREIFDQAEDGSVAVHEIRESFDLFTLDGKTHLPDHQLPDFRKNFNVLADRSLKVNDRLLQALSLVLGKERYYFSELHNNIMENENASAIRTIYYPPIQDPVKPGYIRCGEHTDYGTLTLLFQDDFPGLEIKTTTGQWISADPIDGAILVNIGDLLEMWTAARYPATMHRVVIPKEEVRRRTKRQSIVFFIHPHDEVIVEPLGPPDSRFPPVTAKGHVDKRFAATFKY